MDPSEDLDESNEELHPVLMKVKEQVPSVFKLIQVVQSKLPKKKKETESIDPPTDLPEGEEAPKKKTKIKVIHIVFLALFGFLLFEDDIFGTSEEVVESKQIEVKKVKTKKIQDSSENSENIVKAEAEKVPVKEDKGDPLMIGVGDNKKVEPTEMDSVADVEGSQDSLNEDITNLFKNEMNKKDDSMGNTPDVDSTISTADVPKEEEPVEKIDYAALKEQEIEKQKKEEMKKRIDESDKLVNSKLKDDSSDDFLIDDFSMDDSSEDLTKSIMEGLEEKVKIKKEEALIAKNNSKYDLLDVVNYDVPGRGLVYNCADKHWACVTVKSYSYCQNNFKFDQQDQKVIQCFPKAIYESDYDCEAEQLLNVSNSADTSFCN